MGCHGCGHRPINIHRLTRFKMKIYLVRHGETTLNRLFKYIGSTDVDLTKKGVRQAEALSQRLQQSNIKAVYSSDLLRARRTAEAIATAHNLHIKPVSGLREIDFGAWEGLSYYEIDAKDHDNFHAWLTDPEQALIPQGEKWRDFKSRVLGSVYKIIDEEKDGNVVIVSHGGPIKVIMGHFNGDDPAFYKMFWPSPGSLSVVEVVDYKAKVLLLNEQVYTPEK